jgi:beta-1,4-N-acetylglucosaminyltransferase
MKKALFVCSGGGHLAELRAITPAFDGLENVLVSYPGPAVTADFHRACTVPAPLSVGRVLTLCAAALRIVRAERPAVIVSAGSEITIPFFIWGKLFGAKLIYLESGAQVYSLSITGRLVYPLADLFLVQWKYLAGQRYRRARYVGGLV